MSFYTYAKVFYSLIKVVVNIIVFVVCVLSDVGNF